MKKLISLLMCFVLILGSFAMTASAAELELGDTTTGDEDVILLSGTPTVDVDDPMMPTDSTTLEDETEEATEEGVQILASGQAFVTVALGSDFEGKKFNLYENKEIVSSCVADDAGSVKFLLNADKDSYYVALEGAKIDDRDFSDEEREPLSVVLEFFMGEEFAGREFTFSQDNETKDVAKVTANENGSLFIMGGQCLRFLLVADAASGAEDIDFEDVYNREDETEATEVEENDTNDKKGGSNLAVKIMFPLLLVCAIGYLVYDKVSKSRKEKETYDDDDSDEE